MNKGLKKYTKQISLTVGNAAETSINVNKDDANLHISIPLISSVGLCQIETNLIFNLQDKNVTGLFGKGFKLNFCKDIKLNGGNIEVKNADGSTDLYKSSESFKNKETGLEVRAITDDEYGAYHFEVKDKYDNLLEFDRNQSYPRKITYKNGYKITSDFIAATKYIENGCGDKIIFTKNGKENISLVEYVHNGSTVCSVIIDYDANGYISKLTYKNGNTIVATTSLVFTDTDITVVDDLSGYRIKYFVENNKVTSFIDGYDSTFINGHLSNIDYFDGYSLLTNYKNKKSYCFFNNNNLPSFEMDEDNNIIETEYDEDTKDLKSSSGSISFNSLENLFSSNDVASFNNNGLVVNKVTQSDDKFAPILGDSVYKISGTGTLTKTIAINGMASDCTLAVLFGKQLTPASDSSYVKVSLFAGGSDSDKFNKTKIDNQFELMTLGTSSDSSFEIITLKIELVGNADIEIGGIKIANKEFAAFYTYDQNGNVSEMGSGSSRTNMSYNSANLPSSSLGVDSTIFNYKYDNYGNLISAETAYGAKIENIYHPVYKGNLTSNKVTSEDGSKVLETKKTYTSDGRFVASTIDELGNVTSYNEYDAFGKIIKVTNALNAASRFTYNGDGTLNKILLSHGADSTFVSYNYDSKKRLSKVTLSNGSIYDFVYDSLNNIKEIKLNDVLIFTYEYDLTTGNLVKQSYGSNSDSFIFEYNEDDLITNIYYQVKNENKKLKYKYYYNNDKQLVKVEDESGKLLNEYQYDQNNRINLIKTANSTIKNTYDNLGNVVTKAVNIDGQNYYSSFDTISRSKGSHPGSIYETLQKFDAYIGLFNENGMIVHQKAKEGLNPIINHTSVEENLSVEMDGVVPCVSINSNKRLTYQLPQSLSTDFIDPRGMIGFWFKPNSSTSTIKQYLFSTHMENSNDKDFIGIYLLNGYVYLEAIDYKGNAYQLIKTNYKLDLTKWNFIGLNYINRCDGPGYPDICEYDLFVNANRIVYKKQDPRLNVDCGFYSPMNIGHKYMGETSCSYDFNGKIACLIFGRGIYLENSTILKYYRLTKDYIINNQLIDEDAKTVDFSQTSLFTINQSILNMFEIYPLQNNVISLNGKKPIKFNIRNCSNLDKDRTFNFNNDIKRYAYVADGEDLIYDFGISDAGTIAMRVYTDVGGEIQYILDGLDDNNQSIKLYKDSEDYICISVGEASIQTRLKFNPNEWHTIALSFKESIASSSQGKYKCIDVRIMVDEDSWNTSIGIPSSFGNIKFLVGKAYKETEISSNFGYHRTNYPLWGQIEMIATRPAYCEISTLNTLRVELIGLTKVSEFDELGMLKKVDIHECGKSILTNTYEYKKRSTNSKYISKQISKEIIKCGSTTINRNYESDALGNITKITDSVFGSHTYEYDYRGFLVKADGETFEYDGNGNIVKKGNFFASYDSVIKDRLIAFNGVKIEYDSSNPLNPKTYSTKNYKFDGRRLVRWTHGTDYYDYVYNDQGLRIQKRDDKGVTWDYTYDGNKLIREKHLNITLDFLYDENSILYGFIKNNSEKYLYIRDSLQNILGIADITGKIVVKYNYDAWGTTSIIEDVSGIGNLNPFRYKGYYYDCETQLYWVSSRYYSPELCRWISPDSIEYLDFESINGLNLYAYCGNDPINRFDPTGRSWESFWNGVGDWFSDNWVKLAIGAGVIALGVLTMGAATLISGAGVAATLSAMGTAAVSSLAQVGISTSISAGIGLAVGGITSGSWEGAVDGMLNGIADGFMWGGIFAGAGQVLSGAMRITRTLAPEFNGVQIGRVKLWSPNSAGNQHIGGTLIKFGRFNRIDSEIGNMIHIHLKLLGHTIDHFPIGMIAGGVIGGL